MNPPVSHYVMLDGQQQGPFSMGQLQAMWQSGRLTSETQHFMDGYSEWCPLDYIREDLEPQARRPAASAMPRPVHVAKSRGIYVILGLFLGGLFGIHNFYVGRFTPAIIQLLVTAFTGWLFFPLVIVAVWVICELIFVTKDGKGVPMS